MRPLPTKTTKLPKQLLDELGENGFNRYRATQKFQTARRKERRKAERDQKKVRRQHQSTAIQVDGKYGFDGPKVAKLRVGESLDVQTKRAKQAVQFKSVVKSTSHDIQRASENVTSLSPTRISRGLRDKLAEDDAEIAALERKLGIKNKKLPKAFADDGLGTLHEGLDVLLVGLGKGGEIAIGGEKRKRGDGDDWLERKRRNAMTVKRPGSTSVSEGDSSPSEGSVNRRVMALGNDENCTELLHDDPDLSDGPDNAGDSIPYSSVSPSEPATQRVRENPYSAPTSALELQPVKYLPPSLRKPSASESEALLRLRRQMQGLLNRLSEPNLLSILGEVECLYRDNPRQRVTSTLVELIFNIVCDMASLTDTFLVLHAGFIAAIYRVVGVDFGASVVQRIVEEFDHHYNQGDGAAVTTEQSSSGKKTTNLMALLGELYNFQVIGSNLIFDFICMFLSRISELNTELLLKIIKTSGPKLRQDDPSALKGVILMLQPAITSVGEAGLSARTKFMIETINNLKNNRVKTGVAASAVKLQHIVQMKKLLGSLNMRTIRASEPLRLGLQDVRDADEKGKWWLVGAGWKKDDEDLRSLATMKLPHRQDCTASAEVDGERSMDLEQLAREQRMNTDIRRAIFISIMSAADCREAHERLIKLRLKRAQELEIPRVLIHCAGAEQVYNPYYTLMAKRLCCEHRMKMAFQFSLWDLFKRMGEGGDGYCDDAGTEAGDEVEGQELGMRRLVNLAKMFGNLIVEGSLGLGVLKTLNLDYLQPKTRTFVELMFITIFLQSQRKSESERDEGVVVGVFMQVMGMPHVARGLRHFVKKVVSKTDVAGGKGEKETVRWGCKIAGNALRAIEASKATGE